nr:hypothetical protein [Tanacetum cinerariifolium]
MGDEHLDTIPATESDELIKSCVENLVPNPNESPFTCDSTPNIVDDSPNDFNPPSQPPKYSYEFSGNDAYYGHDCPPQQYLCCTHCGGPRVACQCDQLIFNEPYYENCGGSHMNSNSFGFDQFLPHQLPVIDQTPLEESMKNLQIAFETWSENIQQKKEEEEKQITKEQAAKARYWKIPICHDDDEDYNIVITPKEPDNSLSMGDEHLNTILEMKSDEFIKSSVENLVPNPSESEGEHECDVPACDDFTTFSNLLFDIDSLLDEFAGELTLLKSIPLGINETDCDPKEEIHLIKKLLYDNPSPRPPEEFISENSDVVIKSFSPSPIPVEDSDSFMEEIDLSFTPDDLMSPGIEEDD